MCDNVYIKCYCLHAYIGLDVISLNINCAEKALTCVIRKTTDTLVTCWERADLLALVCGV